MSALGNNERMELSEIDHALVKIEEGTFGICEDSGELIAEARLDAIPTARYTREVQEMRERNPSMVDRPRRRVLSGDDINLGGDDDQ
jgi:RNA polymerase-binding transcription factor DksA